jgi:hypothetical protein
MHGCASDAATRWRALEYLAEHISVASGLVAFSVCCASCARKPPHHPGEHAMTTSHATAQPQPAAAEYTTNNAEDSGEAPDAWHGHLSRFLAPQLSCLTSAAVHTALLLALAFLVLPDQQPPAVTGIDMSPTEPIEEFDHEIPEPIDVKFDVEDLRPASMTPTTSAPLAEPTPEPPGLVADKDPGDIDLADDDLGFPTDPGLIGGTIPGGPGGDGDGPSGRKIRFKRYEKKPVGIAVAAALRWLAAHQMPDGSWNFNHCRGSCQGRCANPGSLSQSTRAATAMALMTFLGAGQTHMEGEYRPHVKAGLAYLMRTMRIHGSGGSLEESGGSMYAHGLGSIALCEAYAMTRDRGLLQPAQMSLNYISYAQDPVGGGWRYRPQQPGDTSVFGWQFMALKSGHMGYLNVDPDTVKGAIKFLDSVQSNSGANYGYTGPGAGKATTAVGLLCRMYHGWSHHHPALERGVSWLDQQGPSKTDMYYNYYATQVMRHYDGEVWTRWDNRMKPYLLQTQSRTGHQTGSWYFDDPHGGSRGGRLYCTTMAAMTLEVYYRHLPIYQTDVVDEEFQF